MKPAKHLVTLFILSLIIVIFKAEVSYVISWLFSFYLHMLNWLSYIFSMGSIGLILQKTVSLFLIPLIIAGIITGIFYAFRKKTLAVAPEIAWAVWLAMIVIVIVK